MGGGAPGVALVANGDGQGGARETDPDSRGASAVEIDLHTNKAAHRASAAWAGAPEGAPVDATGRRKAEAPREVGRRRGAAGQRQRAGDARGDGSAAAGADRPGHHGLGQGTPQEASA
ncbi:hypothetical protein ACQ4PT_055388 [Festuca glaucescens]